MKKILLLTLLFIFSCSTQKERAIENEKGQVKGVHSRDEMIERTRDILEKSNLSTIQKEKFLELHGHMIMKVNELNDEFNSLKVVMFNEMTKPKRDRLKLNKIISQIKKIHQKKLDLMLNSFDEVDRLVGDKGRSIYQEDWFLNHISM